MQDVHCFLHYCFLITVTAVPREKESMMSKPQKLQCWIFFSQFWIFPFRVCILSKCWVYDLIFQGTETAPATLEKTNLTSPPHQDSIIL